MGFKSTKLRGIGDAREGGRRSPKTVEFAEELEVPGNFGSRPAFFEEGEMVGPVQCWVYWKYFSVRTWAPFMMLFALLFFAVQGREPA